MGFVDWLSYLGQANSAGHQATTPFAPLPQPPRIPEVTDQLPPLQDWLGGGSPSLLNPGAVQPTAPTDPASSAVGETNPFLQYLYDNMQGGDGKMVKTGESHSGGGPAVSFAGVLGQLNSQLSKAKSRGAEDSQTLKERNARIVGSLRKDYKAGNEYNKAARRATAQSYKNASAQSKSNYAALDAVGAAAANADGNTPAQAAEGDGSDIVSLMQSLNQADGRAQADHLSNQALNADDLAVYDQSSDNVSRADAMSGAKSHAEDLKMALRDKTDSRVDALNQQIAQVMVQQQQANAQSRGSTSTQYARQDKGNAQIVASLLGNPQMLALMGLGGGESTDAVGTAIGMLTKGNKQDGYGLGAAVNALRTNQIPYTADTPQGYTPGNKAQIPQQNAAAFSFVKDNYPDIWKKYGASGVAMIVASMQSGDNSGLLQGGQTSN